MSQKKRVQIKGETSLNKTGLPTILTLQGNNILIINNTDYTVYASPHLKLSSKGNSLHLTGNIMIPSALISPKAIHNTLTLPDDQIVIIGQKKQPTHAKIAMTVHLKLGKDVQLNTQGVKAKLQGGLSIQTQPNQSTTASGRIALYDAQYHNFGQQLKITTGSAIHYTQSPLNNPYLNISATKVLRTQSSSGFQTLASDNIIVGISIQGTLKSPKVTLFSNRSHLTQANILSYLVLGYANPGQSSSNMSLLLSAMNTLNLTPGSSGNAGGGVISQLQQGLGLTEFGLETQTMTDAIGNPISQQTSFVVGKRITPKIYLRYSHGVSWPYLVDTNLLQLRYYLNRHWTLQTETSNLGSGGDILYTIEKN